MRISDRLLTVLACCLLAAAIPAGASGKGERELKQARSLVNDKQYTTAMTLIVKIMEDYPDLREETDKLVARIMDVRRRVNEKANELIDAVDRQQVDRGLALIADLNELDPYPDAAVKQLIETATWALQYAGENQSFLAVMKAAAELLADGKYAEAIDAYLDGFDVSRSYFDAASYSQANRQGALEAVARMEAVARQAASSEAGTGALADALDALLAAPSTEPGRETFVEGLRTLSQAHERETEIRSLAVQVREYNAAIDLENGEERSDPWLHFIEQYGLGRSGAVPEGIAFAIRQPWVATVRRMSDTAVEAADAAMKTLEEKFAASAPLDEFRSIAGEARSRALIARSVLETELPAYRTAEGLVLSEADLGRADALAKLSGTMQQRAVDAEDLVRFAEDEAAAEVALGGLERSLGSVPLSPSGTDIDALRSARSQIARVRESAVTGEADWTRKAAAAAANPAMAARAGRVVERYRVLVARTRAVDAEYAVRVAGLETETFEPRRAAAEARQSMGRDFAAGTAGGIPVEAGKQPELAAREYERAVIDIAGLLVEMDAWQETWSSEQLTVSDPRLAALLVDQAARRTLVGQLQNGIAADAAAARTAIQRAEDLRGQGDAGYQAGKAFVKEKRYDAALTEYLAASARYRESLDYQENAAARKRITELSDLILDVEKDANASALAQVSKLIDEAKELQKQSKYADAVAKLEEAKRLWTAVNPTETNNVLELNLLTAQSALKQSGRREITRTDPIYQDVRGFMLQAELSYSAADRLKKTAPTSEEYRQNLETARKSVEAITTAVPEYREARLMDLKIERLEKGEAAFSASLLQRIREALAKTKDAGATEDTLRKTRLSLLDYKEIEGYTSIVTRTTRGQIDAAVVDLEVRLGMRAAPVPAALIALSKTRYQEALTRYRAHRNDQTWWDSVLGLLKESTNANPENTDAGSLYYEIAGRRGSVESLLTQNDEAQWRVAIDAFSKKDYPRAEATVDELLARKPKQPGLLKLKAQIQIARGL